MKKCTLFLCLLLSCASLTSAAYGAERVEDFFYPDGRSSFAIFRADRTEPVGQALVLFERTSKGGRLVEDRQMRLDESANFYPFDTIHYSLAISESAVVAGTWWMQNALSGHSTRGNRRYHLEMLKLPADGQTIRWTTTVNREGTVLQIWEMSANRMGDMLEVKRAVFDAQHKPLPELNVTEYWQKSRGKVKEVLMK